MRKALIALVIGASVSTASLALVNPQAPSAAIQRSKSPQYCLDQLDAVSKTQDVKTGYACLTELVERWPEQLPKVDTRMIVWAYSEQAKSVAADQSYASLNRLFDAYGRTSSPREPESLWMSLAIMAVERGKIDRARSVADHLKNPHYLVSMLMDKSFDPIIDGGSDDFDIERASMRYVHDVLAQVVAQPRRLLLRLQLIDALISANKFDEALRMSDSVASQLRGASTSVAAFDDSEQAFWIADSRARSLRALGRHDEAIDGLKQASRPPEHGNANANLVLNLASYMCASGRPRETLQVLNYRMFVSPYGLMNIHVLRHWAALQMNDAKTAEKELEFMRQHQADNYRAFQSALVAAGRFDEALRLLTVRLSNSVLRTDALMQLQRFNMGPMPLEEQKRELAWQAFSDRPDVRTAVSAVGRIKQFSIGPTQGWD